MLWFCIHLPLLPLEVFTRGQVEDVGQAVIVVEKQRVLFCNAVAHEQGIAVGSSLTTALALSTQLQVVERDPQAEQANLHNLANWAYQFTPSVCMYQDYALLLEVASCLTLFNGLPNLLTKIVYGVQQLGYNQQSGLAHTPEAAYLLARSSSPAPAQRPTPAETLQQLRPLPLDYLRCETAIIEKLCKMGLSTIGEVLDLPTAALGKRFGLELQQYLQKISGERDDPQHFIQPAPMFNSHLFFLDAIENSQMLVFPMQRLLDELCQFLHSRQLHCQQFAWHMQHIDKQHNELIIQLTQAQADKRNFMNLSRIKLEQFRISTSIHTLALKAEQLLPAKAYNTQRFQDNDRLVSSEPLNVVLDKLSARLGEHASYQVCCQDEHLPELASATTHTTSKNTAKITAGAANAIRPTWLLPHPARLHERRQQLYWHGVLQLLHGPERIETRWWEQTARRDYFIAQHESGALYWVYHDLRSRHWFVQGVFS
ncbi:MAG: Y-family DNA polymerase [Pseudomonadales bacterium]